MAKLKAVILAGGLGTRISEYTETIPKPMIEIGGRPILLHIMRHFAFYGTTDFVIAAGYKAEKIKEYFFNFANYNSDFTVNLQNGSVEILGKSNLPEWTVTVVDTGMGTMTGGRLGRLRPILEDEKFFLTYGDGISDVNLTDLLSTHASGDHLATLTAVRPPARFGNLDISNGVVRSFQEKAQADAGWINGGFMVIEPEFLRLIDGDDCVLEESPLSSCAANGRLGAFQHLGFWQCMDTKRDLEFLQRLYIQGAEVFSQASGDN